MVRRCVYRPTVHYAYHPCDSAVMSVHEFAGRNYVQQERQRILMDDIASGVDELGVLLAGHKKNAYWYGSQLSIEEARKLAPYNNATSLQVTIAVLAGRGLGDGESELRHHRARRDGFPAQSRDLHAVPRAGRRPAIPTGRRCTSASGCFPRTSTRPIPGSSRTCASVPGRRRVAASVVDLHDDERCGCPRQLHGYLVVQASTQQHPSQRRVHADVAGSRGRIRPARRCDSVTARRRRPPA